MFAKIKKIIWNIKALIILLILLIIISVGLTIYFGTKNNSQERFCLEAQQKLTKLNYYATLLNKSIQLIRQDKGLDVLEDDVRLLDNGTLLAVWENVVFSGNKKQDVDDYLDVIIDSLIFFSK
jgi:hypothetical protein